MPDTKISALTAGAQPSAGNTAFPAVQGGANVKITDAQLLAAVLAAASTTEFIQDVVGALAAAGNGLTVTYNDAGNALSIGKTIKDNITTSAPTVTDDSSAGYAAGSMWTNTATGRVYVCRSASVGAALWLRVGFSQHTGYVAGRWYAPWTAPRALTSAVAANTMRYYPVILPSRVTIDQLNARCTTLAAGGNVGYAIYASDANGKITGSPLGTVSGQSVAATGSISGALNTNVTLEPGVLYFFAYNSDNATAAFNGYNSTCSLIGALIGDTSIGNINNSATQTATVYSHATTFGSWPDMTAQTPASITSNAVVEINFRAA